MCVTLHVVRPDWIADKIRHTSDNETYSLYSYSLGDSAQGTKGVIHTDLFPTIAQSLVSALRHVSAADCGHLQGAIMLWRYKQHITWLASKW